MAKAQAQAQAEQKPEVVQLGDVTEKVIRSPLSGDIIPLQPLSELPETHKHLAKIYANATGFAVEPNGNLSFHF